MNDLDRFLWKNRPLLVFTPTDSTDAYLDQKAEWDRYSDETTDRDIVLLEIIGDTAQALRDRFGVTEDTFVVILVGKDGTEKARYNETVNLEQVFALIDTMPMRRRELRDQQ